MSHCISHTHSILPYLSIPLTWLCLVYPVQKPQWRAINNTCLRTPKPAQENTSSLSKHQCYPLQVQWWHCNEHATNDFEWFKFHLQCVCCSCHWEWVSGITSLSALEVTKSFLSFFFFFLLLTVHFLPHHSSSA